MGKGLVMNMSPVFQPTGMSIEINRKRREARKRRPMAHIENGFPHHRHNRCICLDLCCHDPNNGCICKECICRIEGPECHANITHPTLSADALAILSGEKPSTLTDTDTTNKARKRQSIKSPERTAIKTGKG